MSERICLLQVFYDGACPICAHQVRKWRQRDRHGRLELIDIAVADFRPEHYGLDARKVRQAMHVRTADGRVFVGIDALRMIWHALPACGLLWHLSRVPGFGRIMEAGYRAFARHRHRLRKVACVHKTTTVAGSRNT